MSSYSWPIFPEYGTANFELTARTALETWRTNASAVEVRVNELEDGTFFSGLSTPVIPSSSIVSLDPDLFPDKSIPENKLDIDGSPVDGSVAVWREAAGGRVYETIEGVVGGDTYQVKYSASGSATYLENYIASESDISSGTAGKIVDAAGLHSAMIPIGAIIPWIGGYFTNNGNGGFVNVLGNNAGDVNARFNPRNLYVCNGAQLFKEESPIFNGPGRYLPNLTDDRFLMGDNAAGSVGGSSSMQHTHEGGSHRLTISEMPPHDHDSADGKQFITVEGEGGTVAFGDYWQWNKGEPYTASEGGGDPHDHGQTTGASNTENRPNFLSCFFLMRVA